MKKRRRKNQESRKSFIGIRGNRDFLQCIMRQVFQDDHMYILASFLLEAESCALEDEIKTHYYNFPR